jgi:hypothetical protein
MNSWSLYICGVFVGFSRLFLLVILILKGLTARRLYKLFGVKGLTIETTAGGEDTDAIKTVCLYHGLTILPLVSSCQPFVCKKPKLQFIYSSDNRTLQNKVYYLIRTKHNCASAQCSLIF